MPIKLLHEGEGHVVTVELKNGETYRGMLTEAEDSMNCQMKEGTHLISFEGKLIITSTIDFVTNKLHSIFLT